MDGQEYLSKFKDLKQTKKIKECLKKHSEERCYRSGVYFSRLLDRAGAILRFKYYSLRWFFPKANQMHNKYLLIDGKSLLTGSYNWSNNAEFNTFENVAIFHRKKNAQILNFFRKNFAQINRYGAQKGESGFHQLYGRFGKAKKSIPMHFEPIAATVEQIDRLKTLALRKCPRLYQTPASATKCFF